ncbi:MAG: hypothetical protein CMJ34_14250 [Phycisphaerae bacterium]|nr:hypothetical protein [Phycisphaerae bacterium]
MSDEPIQDDAEMLDDPEAGSTWFLSVVSVVVMVVTVLGLVVMFFDFADAEIDRKIVDRPAMSLETLKLDQQKVLTEYGTYEMEDADGNPVKRIRIPVNQAMDLVLADERSRSEAESEPSGTMATR